MLLLKLKNVLSLKTINKLNHLLLLQTQIQKAVLYVHNIIYYISVISLKICHWMLNFWKSINILCHNCLHPRHYSTHCKHNYCRICNRRHNLLLHKPDSNICDTTNSSANTCSISPSRGKFLSDICRCYV